MRRSTVHPPARMGPAAVPGGRLLAALVASASVGLVVAVLLLAPPRGEAIDLAIYFVVSGAATLAGARGLLWLFDRVYRPSLPVRTQVVAALAPAIALANIAIVAQLMFVSTGHDLRLLVALIAFGGIAGVLFGASATTDMTRRLDGIVGRVRRLATGDYAPATATERGGDEIDRLGRDIEELARRLRESERQRELLDRERRELTSAISHDLRTPLTSIRAMVEALDDGMVQEPADVRRYYGAIWRETDRLSSMVDDLLELARLDAGVLALSRERVALEDIVRDVVESLRVQGERQGVGLSLESGGGLPALELDRGRIERALTNLVKNAVEHTPGGGTVRVSITRDGECVAVQVVDSGAGIPEEDLPHIWTRFYRGDTSRARSRNGTQPGGTGLGLAITRGFVEAHGGSVSAESAPGHGARFTVKLPT
ncbi:MAG: HAMP domain-containing sensor histidine kinase [Dehalococcoidia bacterium]|nr:HAMP domain-containing sensor histidine kinase [Dehalococcoidia bacterium]